MRKPHTESNDHPTADELAAFVDKTVSAVRAAHIRTHLDTCDECMDAYHFALRSRATGRPEPGPAAEDLETVLHYADAGGERAASERTRPWRWIGGRRFAYGAAAAMVVAVAVVAALTVFRQAPGPGFDPDAPAIRPVTVAMVSSSEQRPVITPGVEDRLGDTTVTLRSGAAPVTEDFNAAMSGLVRDYNDGRLPDGGIRWIIGGYLATLQIENARTVIDDVRPRMKDDPDFRVLEAILAYHENDLDSARRILQRVVAERPDHRVAIYDLAVVLDASGDSEGARALLQKLKGEEIGTPIAERAARMLEGLESE
jgi:hypothetical protein